MKKTSLQIVTALCILLAPLSMRAQVDVHFSQFYEISILRNPALTGVFADDYKAGVIYRNQWSSISNPFVTAMANAEMKFKMRNQKDFLSIGLLAYYDKAGGIDRKILSVYPAINYNKSLEDRHNSFLSVGFTSGYMQYSYDPSKATFNNQYQNNAFSINNPTGEQLPNPKLGFMDMGAGINFNTSVGADNNLTYVIGVSGYHFTQPKTSLYKDPSIYMDTRWNVNAALSNKLDERYILQLQTNVAIQGSAYEIIAGGLLGWNSIDGGEEAPVFTLFFGAFYRYQDAVIPTVKLRYKDMSFGVSYDINVSTLKAGTELRGGYELSVYKTGMFRNKAGYVDKVLCPNFY